MMFCCLLCGWDGCIKTSHYKKRERLSQQSLEPGAKNVQQLLSYNKKHFGAFCAHHTGNNVELCQGLDHTRPVFRYLAEKFPGISATKVIEGVCVGSPDLQPVQRRSFPPNSHL